MARSGLWTISNNYETKNLELRSGNIVALPYVTATSVAEALAVVTNYVDRGNFAPLGQVRPITLPAGSRYFDAGSVVADIVAALRAG